MYKVMLRGCAFRPDRQATTLILRLVLQLVNSNTLDQRLRKYKMNPPLNLPLGSLKPSSEILINRKTYKPDHTQIFSRFKPRQLLPPLASGEYPIHGRSDKIVI